MRTRFQVSLNADNPRHNEAAGYLAEHEDQRSEYIVSCILLAEQNQSLQDIVRQALREELCQQPVFERPTVSPAVEKTEAKTALSEVPKSLLGFMDQL